MKDQVVRAGKYASVGIVLLAALPLLIPLLFVLSFLGFTFLLPLGCALGGLVFLRKMVAMLYRKLPLGSPLGASQARIVALPHEATFSALPLKDQQAIETFAEVDHEFDAVVVSTAPTEILDFGRDPNDGRSIESEEVTERVPDEVGGSITLQPSFTSVAGKDQEERPLTEGAPYAGALEQGQEQKQEETSTKEKSSYASIPPNGQEEGQEERSPARESPYDSSAAEAEGEAEKNSQDDQHSYPAIAAKGQEKGEEKSQQDDTSYSSVVAAGQVKTNGSIEQNEEQQVQKDEQKEPTQGEQVDKVEAIETRAEDTAVDTFSSIDARPTGEDTSTTGGIGSPGGSTLLPNQANEEDIWICKDCGWKYPNARPSAKIRRNHKKHCGGRASKVAAAGDEVSWGSSDEEMDGGAPGVDDSGHREFVGTKIEDQTGTGAGGEKTEGSGTVTADESLTGESTEGVDTGPTSVNQELSAQGELPSGSGHYDPESGTKVHNFEGSRAEEIAPHDDPLSNGAFDAAARTDEEQALPHSPRSVAASESFRSAPEEFTDETSLGSGRWSGISEGVTLDEEYHPTQVQEELQLREDLEAVKGVLGDEYASKGPLLTDIRELSAFLGIDLPPLSEEVIEFEWAKVAVALMKVVVGVE